MMILVWLIATLLVAFMLYFYIIPHIKERIAFWKMLRAFKKLKKKYPDSGMDKVVNAMKKVLKNHEL